MVVNGRSALAKFFAHDWTKVMAVILAIVGALVAAEHRITVNEQASLALAASDKLQVDAIKHLEGRLDRDEERQVKMLETEAQITANLAAIQKRHDREDEPYHPPKRNKQ